MAATQMTEFGLMAWRSATLATARFSGVNWAGTTSWQAADTTCAQYVPQPMTLYGFKVAVDVAPGSGKSRSFTIYKNGAATTLVATVSGTATTAEIGGLAVQFAQGDTISMNHTSSGSPAAIALAYWRITGVAEYQPIMWSTNSNNAPPTTVCIEGGPPSGNTLINSFVSPVTGSIKGVYYQRGSAVASDNVVTLSNVTQGTSIVVTLSAGQTLVSDLSSTLSVTEGDRIAVTATEGAPTSTPTKFSFGFRPTTQGETIRTCLFSSPSNSATSYGVPAGVSGNAATEQTDLTGLAAYSKMYVYASSAPGTAKSYALTFRVNGVDSTLTATVSGSGTTASDTSHTVNVALNDSITVSAVPSGTPTSPVNLAVSFKRYVAPVNTRFLSTRFVSTQIV